MKLEGKVAIVTGGGWDIGKDIALAFAREGTQLVLAARTLPEAQTAAIEVGAFGRRALAGRLVSAVWDHWRSFPLQPEEIMDSDLYTLHRITAHNSSGGKS